MDLDEANRLIKRKCPEMCVDWRQKDDNTFVLELKRLGKVVSDITLLQTGRTLFIVMSYTSITQRRKYYHDLLLSVLILLCIGKYDFIETNSVSWKTVYSNHKHGFRVANVVPRGFTTHPLSQKDLEAILRSKTRLRDFLSGDDQDETKPWMSVVMRLPLNEAQTVSRQQSNRQYAIQSMTC